MTSLPGIPLKSTAIALAFSILFGPLGLLYASFWGGILMISIGMIVISSKLFFPSIIFWMICSVFAVGAVEAHNKKILVMKDRN